jgi:ipoprotein LpqH
VKRKLLGVVGGVAIMAGSLTGCGGNGQSRTAESPAAPAPGTAKLVVDGKDQKVQGPVACPASEGTIDIKIGAPENGVGATVTQGDKPVVNYVGVGIFDGVSMGYLRGVDPNGKADATKQGNTYKLSGIATGRNTTDLSNIGPVVSKPFELTASCP